jgi:hypothetical protein
MLPEYMLAITGFWTAKSHAKPLAAGRRRSRAGEEFWTNFFISVTQTMKRY